MKKIIPILIVSIFLISSCGTVNDAPIHYDVDAKTPYFDNLKEMEDFSDLIVKGIRQGHEETIVTTVNGNIVSGYTFSSFQITDIYKDDSGSLKSGDIITILENEYYVQATNTIYHVAGYDMMVKGKEYLLFLTDSKKSVNQDYYVAAGVNFGTVSLQADGRNELKTLRTYKDMDVETFYNYYDSLWKEAIRKYIPTE